MNTLKPLRRALLALLPLFALVPASADAAAWRPPVPLPGPAETPAGFDVAAGPDGTVVVAFTKRNPDLSSQVMATVRPPGGSFSEPEPLGSPFGGFPAVAVDGKGTATVVWEQRVGNSTLHTIEQSTRPAGGSFSAPQDLSSFLDEAVEADIAVNPRGDTLVSWTNRKTSPNFVEAAGRPAGEGFGPRQRVSGPNVGDLDNFGSQVAVGEDGSGMVVWERQDGLARATPWSAALGSFGSDFTVTAAAELAQTPDVAMTPGGNAVFAYSAKVTGGEAIRVRTRTSGVVGGPVDLAEATASARAPRLVANAAGDMLAAWRSGTTPVIRASFRPAGRPFRPADTLSGSLAGLVTPRPAITPAGDAMVAWLTAVPTGRLQARTRPRSGPFSPLRDDFGVRTGLAAFADVEGNVGTLSKADATTLELRPFDDAPPQPLSLAVPSDAAAGRAAPFSASFRDTWSPFSVAWRFGDGATASGAAVQHAYAQPGAFTAAATATDAAGNAGSRSAAVAVRGLQPAEVDADGDGFPADRDCDESDPAIRPGAKEVRGNGVDENCDGKRAPFLKVRAAVTLTGGFGSGFVELKSLVVTGVKKGDVVKLACKGPGCVASAKAKVVVKRKTRSLRLTQRVQGTRLRKGARIEVAVSHPRRIARIFRFTVKRLGRAPVKTELCRPPGARKRGTC